jgi:hypothetical protein
MEDEQPSSSASSSFVNAAAPVDISEHDDDAAKQKKAVKFAWGSLVSLNKDYPHYGLHLSSIWQLVKKNKKNMLTSIVYM